MPAAMGSERQFVLGVDLDGVVADFTAGLCLFVLITTSAHPEVMIGAAVAGWSLGRLR